MSLTDLDHIREKDLVLIYLDEKRHFLIQIQKGLKLSSDYGSIDVQGIVDKPFGYTGKTHLGHQFYCLKPSISDMMMKLRRTTTIVYPKDLGYLLLATSIQPGSRVIEIGTGSGAMTMVLSRLVAPNGKVFSYDRRSEFIENARMNLARSKALDCVEFRVRDVGKEGFIDEHVDAVFVDVPEPWEIVAHAATALKGGHHFVSWSPNVEQVRRTVEMLSHQSFIMIKVSEILERELLVRERGTRPRERSITHTAYLVQAQKVIPTA